MPNAFATGGNPYNFGTGAGQVNSGSGAGVGSWLSSGLKKITGIADESQSAKDQRRNLENQGGMASVFADQGQQGYGAMTEEAKALRAAMQRRASGQDSLSAEQLRQGLQQNLSAQRSMAASASPQNAVMAARNAANNMNRAGIGMSGQAAMAGIQERAAAENALAKMIMEQRQQDINVGLGSRQNAISGFSGYKPEGSTLDKWGGAISGGLGYFGNSGGGK